MDENVHLDSRTVRGPHGPTSDGERHSPRERRLIKEQTNHRPPGVPRGLSGVDRVPVGRGTPLTGNSSPTTAYAHAQTRRQVHSLVCSVNLRLDLFVYRRRSRLTVLMRFLHRPHSDGGFLTSGTGRLDARRDSTKRSRDTLVESHCIRNFRLRSPQTGFGVSGEQPDSPDSTESPVQSFSVGGSVLSPSRSVGTGLPPQTARSNREAFP